MNTKEILEHGHQVRIVDWLRFRRHVCFAVPNAAKRTYALANFLKKEGLTAGAPDIVIVTPPPKFPGYHCAIETKQTEDFTVSAAQKEMHQLMRGSQWIVIIAKGDKDGIAQLTELGY